MVLTAPAQSLETTAPSRPVIPTRGIWRGIRDEALQACDRDATIAAVFERFVLSQPSLEHALIEVLAARLEGVFLADLCLRQTFVSTLDEEVEALRFLERDLRAVYERDPACRRLIEPLLYFKGFHALQVHRFAHALWMMERKDVALFLQSAVSARFQVDIHPATEIGGGVFFDHATGIVIGETARVANDVSILQGVTLGGTGKDSADRHPKVDTGVLVGAGAKVLGNIKIGKCARIAASSVVLNDVPELATVAGIPAKIVGKARDSVDQVPSICMDHSVPDQTLLDNGSGI